MPATYLLFAATIFVSSFLLFQVQPLIGKHILPFFGGSAMVWITAMLFFMVALAVGYGYALWLSGRSRAVQLAVHSVLTVGTIALLLAHASAWPSGITPNLDELALTFSSPTLAVLETLILAIGLPFVLLSATSTLVQVWYHRVSQAEPFSLYAISNAGSLLGLISYPFIFEPRLATVALGSWWVLGVGVYAALMAAVVYLVATSGSAASASKPMAPSPSDALPVRRFLTWLGVAAVPVFAMLAATSFMTTSIAPVPFLWVGPLALYLLSFVVSFRDGSKLPYWFNVSAAAALLTAALALIALGTTSPLIALVSVHLAIFSLYHWCHDYLYELRPHPSQLARFYVAIALGGIAASLTYTVLTEFLLALPVELLLVLSGALIVALLAWWRDPDTFFPVLTRLQVHTLVMVLALFVTTLVGTHIYERADDALVHARNFFGYKAVTETEVASTTRRSLTHGMTNHGFQYADPDRAFVPSSYYSTSSGLASAFAYARDARAGDGVRVAIAGLGTGAILAYCESGDEFFVAEIDPEVLHLARGYFTFLDHCPQAEIEIRDARLAFSEQRMQTPPPQYDLIILDAYADDMMPIHLMTADAVGEYLDLLAPDGILAIHISSRYLELRPVILGNAVTLQLAGRQKYDLDPIEGAVPSLWTLLVREEETFTHPAFAGLDTFEEYEPLVWTDTYSALFPVVKWW